MKFPWIVAVMLLAVETAARGQNPQQAPPAAAPVFNVRQHGARGDGETLDTAALNGAIEACEAAGGGQVLVPPGRYLTGTVHLKSRVTLVIEAGATVVGSTDLEHYQHFTPPADKESKPFLRWHRALVLGDGIEDAAIVGAGTIDGNKVFDAQGEERMRGPHTILLGNSRNVALRGISIRDSANYAILMKYCEQIDVRDITFTGGWDGVHFRHGREVTITGCRFFTGDDSIAGSYWEHVLISDCVVNSSCNGVRLIGPAEHLVIHDCLFYGPGLHEHRSSSRRNMLAGIILQPGAWDKTEGRLDDVLLSELTMRHVTTPLHVALQPGNQGGEVVIERLSASGAYRTAASIESWDEAPLKRAVLRDVSIEFEGGGTTEQALMEIKQPPTDARPLPVWGLFARHVNELVLENVRLSYAREDARPPLRLEDVERAQIDELRYPAASRPPLFDRVRRIELHGKRFTAEDLP
jgi:hypothetical protein